LSGLSKHRLSQLAPSRRGDLVKLALSTLLSLLFFAGCESRVSDGTGSQTGNSIVAGKIAPSDSLSTGASIQVFLRPLSWTSGQNAAQGGLQSTFTDSQGNYRFYDVPADNYRIEATRDALAWSKTVRAFEGATNYVPTGYLKSRGHLILNLDFADTLRGGRIEFYGLVQSRTLPETVVGKIAMRFDNLPVGLQTVRVFLPTLSSVYCETPVRIGPDSVSVIDYSDLVRPGRGPAHDE
jgi:hypothetical protein